MHVLYVSTLCSDKKFIEIFEGSTNKPQQQAQKFHSLLSKGLMNSVDSLYVMSRPPVNVSTDKKIKVAGVKESNNHVTYHYLKIIERPILKHLSLFINGFLNAINWSLQNKKQERAIICDVLNLSISVSALFASKFCRVKSVAVVTDIPSYMQKYNKQKKPPIRRFFSNLYTTTCNYFICRYDFYIILTEQMNKLVNPFKKPYIVIEGMVDSNMKNSENSLHDKYKEKIIIYAGALKEVAGIRELVEAFINVKDDSVRLCLYGSGELEDEIKKYERKDHRIRFFGVVPNEVVVKEQLKAILLVNPRPSKEEFTKYSFPSKNMEYMASGTPILTTPLQGMPNEYYDYVYLFEDETIDGISKTLENILSKSKEELHDKGIRAKEFVLSEKNNIVQANKILEMIHFETKG